MSETETPITALPPQHRLVASSNGFTSWRADYQTIVIDPLPNGKRMVLTLYGGERHSFDLDNAQAGFLAQLLSCPSPSIGAGATMAGESGRGDTSSPALPALSPADPDA